MTSSIDRKIAKNLKSGQFKTRLRTDNGPFHPDHWRLSADSFNLQQEDSGKNVNALMIDIDTAFRSNEVFGDVCVRIRHSNDGNDLVKIITGVGPSSRNRQIWNEVAIPKAAMISLCKAFLTAVEKNELFNQPPKEPAE